MPDRVNDEYFKRQKAQKQKQGEGDIFVNKKKEVYIASEEKKADQSEVDRQILDVIRKLPEKKLMFGYLGAMFSLSNNQFPHAMVFKDLNKKKKIAISKWLQICSIWIK